LRGWRRGLKLSRTKRSTAVRREAGNGTSAERASSESERGSSGRRFAPSQQSLTEGGTVYGTLVADQRAKRGLTQTQLAAIIRTTPSTIARIEQGHPPSAEIRSRLAVVLTTEPPGPVRRALAHRTRPAPSPRPVPETPPRPRLRMPRVSIRWLWGSVAVANILIALILGGRLSGSHSSASPLQPSLAVSAAPSALAAVHRTRTRAENVAAAQARRAAERRRERAAAAAAAAAAARKAAAKAARQATPVNVPPVTQPVAPTPAPSGGGGGGGGGSSAPAPDLTHGIGAQGG
jgi:transcriptional regulator with XRE-family HTH domain